MNKKSIIAVIVVALVIIAIIFYRASEDSGTYKIGLIDVFTGINGSLGKDFENGIQLALKQYAAAHPNQKIDLIVKDDMENATTTLSDFNELVNTDHINALIVATSQDISTLYPQASKLSIPVLSYGSESNPEAKDTIFHLFPSSLAADAGLGAFARTLRIASSTAGIVGIYTDDPVLTQFYNTFQSAYGSNITEFNLDASMTDKDLQSVAASVIKANPQYIFMSNYADLGAEFIQQLKIQSGGKIKQTFIFDLTLNQVLDQYQETLGDLSFLDGSFVVSTKDIATTTFAADFQKANATQPGELAPYGYDAMSLLLATHSANSSKWVSNIQNSTMAGVTGDIHFDQVGTRIPTFTITTLSNGKIPAYK